MSDKILVINPGSTSTKIAMYDGEKRLWQENIEHPLEELKQYNAVYDQLDMRRELVLKTVAAKGDTVSDLVAVAARGGPVATFESGGYEVTDSLIELAKTNPVSQHVSNVAMGIGKAIADPLGIKCYIYDGVTVDEMIPVTRIVGLKDMDRHGQGHNLNMRAAAINHCREKGWSYYEKNLVVAHLGGGITLSLHSNGRIIDMISDDEGPFSPERSGGLPGFQLIRACFSGKFNQVDMFKQVQRAGGLISLLGTPDTRKVEKMIEEGDEFAKLVYDAMALAVAKNLVKLAATVNGEIDAVILTGGVANSKLFVELVAPRVKFLGPLAVIAGENEMDALAQGILRIVKGQEKARVFKG